MEGEDIDNNHTMKRIRINHNRSPLKLMKKKLNEKNEEQKIDKIKNIEEVIARTEMISKRLESEQKRDELLKMMYYDDIDADHAISAMNISFDELKLLVNELIEMGYIQQSSNDEVELTSSGILYIMGQDPGFFEKKY